MTWASYFIRFGNIIFILPLILNRFSEADQNVWFFLNFIAGLAALSDAGFSPTMVRAYSYFRIGADRIPRDKKEYELLSKIEAKGHNLEQLKRLLTTSFRIYFIIGMAVLVFMATGGVALIMNLMEQAGNRTDLWAAYALFSITTVVSVTTTRWTSAIRGLDYVAFESRVSTFIGVMKTIAFLVLLIIDKGIFSLIVVMLIEATARFWYLRRFVVKWFREKSVELGKMRMFHLDLFQSIWKTTWNTGLTFVALYIIGYIDALIVGQFNDSTAINRFFITKRIFGFVKGFSNAPFYANVQRIYSLGAAKNFRELKKKASIYIFYSMLIIVGFFTGIGLFGNWILSFFTETRLVPLTLYVIMAMTVILDFHSSFHADIYVSTNHFPFLIPSGITGLVIGALGIPVANMYGILGLVVVPFVASMLVNNWYPVYLSFKLTGWNIISYIKDLFNYGYQDLIYRSKRIFI